MLLHPAPIRPSLPFSRYPSPLSPPLLLPLRSSLLYIPSALSRRGRSSLNRRHRELDSTDDAAWNLLDDEEIDDYDEEAFEGRRPRGFVAEGIEYDTALEENLLKEIQRSSKDLTVNLNKVKDKKEPIKDKRETTKKKGTKVKKAQDKGASNAPNKMALSTPTSGIRVRLWNLPKKKNIHRDLKVAFEGFHGILDINPVVGGTKKTRDPVCKGYAFVDLATNEAAARFVETFSTRSISFGRVEKRIGCCIINPSANATITSPNANPTFNKLSNFPKAEMLEPQLHDGFMSISVNNNPTDESPIIFVEEDEEEEDPSSSIEIIKSYDDEADEDKSDPEVAKLPLGERKKAVGLKRRRVRPRKANSSRLSLPLRLKGRERDVLTGIFSKYSANSGPTTSTAS